MKRLTDQSFSDALYDCYTTQNSHFAIAFGGYKHMEDFTYSLRSYPIEGAEVYMAHDYAQLCSKGVISFKNGSKIDIIHASMIPANTVPYDGILCAFDICENDDILARIACFERPSTYRLRKSLSYKPVNIQKETPSEPDSEALDAFLSEFSIMKS